MDNEKTKTRRNKALQKHITGDAKPRRSLRIQSSKKLCLHNIPDLPFDIILNIIARLHVKLIIGCKSLSKAFKNLISGPSFSRIYQSQSNFMCTLSTNYSKPANSIDTMEFDIRDIFDETRDQKPESDRSPGIIRPCYKAYPIWCYNNGLVCLLRYESGLFKLFVTNPILGEFIQLPEPVVRHAGTHSRLLLASGLGYCQFTNRYKILRDILEHGGDDQKRITQIFTIGTDHNWRGVSDVSFPCTSNIMFALLRCPSPQLLMVPFRSAVHWIMYTDTMSQRFKVCAFDMTEEKARELPLPLEVAANKPFSGFLSVLLDKICVWHSNNFGDLDLWAMDDYGVEGSWRKQFVLKREFLQGLGLGTFIPLTVSPEVIMVSGHHKFLLCDMKNKKWSSVIHYGKNYSCPVPFVPSFVSLRNLIPGLMLDV